jgi:hypothetical protein
MEGQEWGIQVDCCKGLSFAPFITVERTVWAELIVAYGNGEGVPPKTGEKLPREH